MLERIVSPYQLLELPEAPLSRLPWTDGAGLAQGRGEDRQRPALRLSKCAHGDSPSEDGECVGDVNVLAPLYGFGRVAELVARKAENPEHGGMGDSREYDGDLERLESMLVDAHARSPLPDEAANQDALNEYLIAVRRKRFF